MESNAIVLVAGVIFLAIAVVGGGFTLERIQVPPVPSWSRVVSGVLGVLFVGTFFYVMLTEAEPEAPLATVDGAVPDATSPAPTDAGDAGTGGGAHMLRDFRGSVPAGDDPIVLTRFTVTSPTGQPQVLDVIDVEFSLRSTASETITLGSTFVGARYEDENEDFGDANNGRELAPGETIDMAHSVSVDRAGTWKVWPCYELAGHTCPAEWEVVLFTVK